MPRFRTEALSSADQAHIRAIAHRAAAIARVANKRLDPADVERAITAVHTGGCPLRLAALREARDRDFTHDVGGILLNYDRTTGRLRNRFEPHFAAVRAYA